MAPNWEGAHRRHWLGPHAPAPPPPPPLRIRKQLGLSSSALTRVHPALPQKVDLSINVGEMAIDYAEVAKREHLTDLELEVRKLNDKAKDVLNEMKYQKDREARFRDTSESSNGRVMWWSLFQMAVLVVAGVWQVMYMRDFLQKKKDR